MEKKELLISKIIMNGFKSFPLRTQVEMSPDITCIVGPNGCGKSNIADAIQWVLGEQKPTEVRLKEMSDVIFAGSKKRKPYSFAEVSLILKKNGSKEDITISRKIHSSGESSYYINEKNVRLKDLKDFLNSENLSINSYAILSQGEIERVALLKPYEKRYLIEECAGIFRFKEKERQILLKLEDTERNLGLTKHLLSEQEKIAHSLKIQAGRAKAYKQIEEEEKNLLKLFFAQERDKLFKEVSGIKEEILKEEERRIHLIKKLNEAEKYLEEMEEKQNQLAKEELDLREKSEKINLALQETRFEMERREEKIININSRNEEVEKEILFLNEEIEKEKNLIQELEAKLNEKEDDIKNFNFQILSEEKILSEIDKKIMDKEEALGKENIPLNEIQKEKMSFGTEIAVLKDSIEKTRDSLSLEEKELKTFSERKILIDEELKNLESAIEESSKEFSKLEEFLKTETEDFERSEEEARQKEREINQLKAEFVKSKELFEREINLIESHKKDERSMAFVLKPPVEWEKFVDILFDEIANSILSEEENPSSEGLYFTQKKIDIPEINGAIPAKEILKLEEGAPQWVLEALPGIFYVEDENNIEELSKMYPHFAFFDKNGRILKGSLYGRPPYSKSGILGSKIRAEVLEKKIREIQEEIENKESVYVNIIEELKLKEEKLKEKISFKESLFLKISELKNKEGQIKIQQKNLTERIEEIKKRIENFKENLRILKEKQDSSTEEAKKYLEREEEIKIKIEKIKKEIEMLKFEEKERQISLQNKLKDLKEREIEKERNLGKILKLKDNLIRNEERYKNLLKEKEDSISLREKLETEKEELENKYFLLKEKEEKERTDLEFKIQEKNKIDLEIKDLQNNLKNLRSEMENNLIKIQEFKTREEILNVKILELKEKSKNFLGINLQDCPSNNEEGLEEKIAKIKEKKERFGQVNQLAEKELEEVLEKLNFIKKQKEDMEKSCILIKNDLSKLEKEALKRFKETFEKVNENFQKYFNYLFGGGQAKIVMQDEENPLDSGVELYVEPPGKKVQHIMLLSGGERALVSLAFLLGLFSTTPSPFLFLDEADASLDDMNVERFINLIKKLKEEIQIILVTHNRRTMEEANLLLGVTMEEPGLSKILSFKLEK